MKFVARGFRVIAVAVIVLASLVIPPRGAQAAGPIMFGIDEGNANPALFKQSGATWDRINLFWNAYQPNGPTDWVSNPNQYDDRIASDLASGIQVVAVVTNPPAWATRNGSVPSGLDLPIDNTSNYWAAFMHKLAATYAGRINYWIIWNEPDFDPQHYANSSWGGTEDEFYLLTKNADLAAKAANPQAKIVFAGTIYWTDALLNRKLFLDRVLDRATATDPTAPANGYYFDAVDIHIYSSPYQLASTPKIYRDVLAKYDLNKPIWVSEMNVVPWDDPESKVPRGGMRATLQEQAAYIIQAVALARANGIERAAVYKLVDGTIERGEPYGLVRNDGSTRPAYQAYQTAMKYLVGTGTTTSTTSGDAQIVTIVNGKQKVTVAWTTKPTAMDLKVVPSGSTAQLVTKVGETTNLTLPTDPNQPDYILHLAGATANTDDANSSDYIIGGDPVILVENGVGDALTLSPTAVYYPITGFEISGAFLDYFQHRGGVDTFGYPISRQFQLQGSQVQLFQRRALQLRPDGTVGQLNLLDPGIMPYTQLNDATFPAVDLTLTKGLPSPGTPSYDQKIQDYVKQNAPNQWNGLTINFGATFFNTVSAEVAFPNGKGNASLLPGIDLELWGVPTSLPAEDPNNHNFVYQRFQRGIMHYDKTTGLTQGLLIGDAFKSIITGQNLPSDLAEEAQGSAFYRQYDASQPHWLARPDQLPNTDLSFAFERQPATP